MQRITITIEEDGKVEAQLGIGTDEKTQRQTIEPETEEVEITAEEKERLDLASDLANCCEYLEDSEVIKIRLIIAKCQKRKEAEE